MSRTRIPVSRQEENTRLMAERLEMSTAEIGLSVRTTNCLEERGIFTVRDLLNSTPDQLLSIANFGEKTLEEVYKALEKFNFYRRSRQPKPSRSRRFRSRPSSSPHLPKRRDREVDRLAVDVCHDAHTCRRSAAVRPPARHSRAGWRAIGARGNERRACAARACAARPAGAARRHAVVTSPTAACMASRRARGAARAQRTSQPARKARLSAT